MRDRAAGHMLRALRLFQEYTDDSATLLSIQTFLTAALHEGSTVSEIQRRMGGVLNTTSRQLLDLSDTHRKGEPGYGLLAVKNNPNDLRTRRYHLTVKGWGLVQRLAELDLPPSSLASQAETPPSRTDAAAFTPDSPPRPAARALRSRPAPARNRPVPPALCRVRQPAF